MFVNISILLFPSLFLRKDPASPPVDQFCIFMLSQADRQASYRRELFIVSLFSDFWLALVPRNALYFFLASVYQMDLLYI